MRRHILGRVVRHAARLGPLRLLPLLLSAAFLPAQAGSARPNFLVIVADDCTIHDLGCYGGQARTPVLDALCEDGLRFANCFQAAPMCSPTRHCLYTGLYPVRSGAYPNHTFAKSGTRSVAHYLSDLGYRVALSGKSHVQPREVFPFEYSRKRAQRSTEPDLQAMDRLFAECAADGTPFCLFACSNEPHSPWNRGDAAAYPPADLTLPPVWVDTPATREAYGRYLAEITFFDRQVGQYLELLERHGHAGQTCVVVLSEQGNSFPFAKWTCYEAGLRSGMIVRWPAIVAAGGDCDALVEYVDLVPTLIEAAGGEPPSSLDGSSFLHVLRDPAAEHDRYVFGLQTTRGINRGPEFYGIRTVRSATHRLIVNLTPGATFWNYGTRDPSAPIWGEWLALADSGDESARQRVLAYRTRPAIELFDVQRDPWCLRNLAGTEEIHDVELELRAELERWMVTQGDAGQLTELRAKERQWGKRRER